MEHPLIDLSHIWKSYDGDLILDDLSLSVKENSFVTLLGPSGCGKTTTLRIIGGFEKPDKGQVIFDGEDITNTPPNKRQLNTVFQKYALFTHMSFLSDLVEVVSHTVQLPHEVKVIRGRCILGNYAADKVTQICLAGKPALFHALVQGLGLLAVEAYLDFDITIAHRDPPS